MYEYCVSLHKYLSSSSNALKHGRMLSNANVVDVFLLHCIPNLSRNLAGILTQLSLLTIMAKKLAPNKPL